MQTISGTWNDDEGAITLVDAHHHLWDRDAHYYPWLSDLPDPHFFLGDYSSLRRNYLVGDYLRDVQHHNVLATVHCEAEWDRADQVGETRWISHINEIHGFPNAIVAHVWFHTPDSAEMLARQAAFPLVRGIRSKPVTGLSPVDVVRGAPGTMQDENWLRGFANLEAHGLSWDLRVPFWHLSEAAEVAKSFPRTPIVLNHTGFPWDRSEEGLSAWRQAMDIIAQQPNVHLKISEFSLKDRAWDFESNRGVVLDAISIFGIERCMFATNFPVSGVQISYDSLVTNVNGMLQGLSRQERTRFFVDNAVKFYRLPDPV